MPRVDVSSDARRERERYELDWDGCAWPVEGLGPGRRVALWVRGCDLRCPGCMAVDLWRPGAPTPLDEVESLVVPGLERYGKLTISGGEPFRQAAALAELVRRLRARLPLEVLVYSGYTLAELEARDGSAALLDAVDLLIDGRYEERRSDLLRWRGSDNQSVHVLSRRGARYRRLLARATGSRPRLQIQRLGGGRLRLIGIPRREDLQRYRVLARERGVCVSQSVRGSDGRHREGLPVLRPPQRGHRQLV
jgi:anaerobic ribonucleoside-triphosphate reductase activating protein